MKIDDNLSEIFDVEVYQEHDVIKPDGTVIPPDNNEAENDYQKVRQNFHNILEYGNKSLDLIYTIAVSTEDPKSIHALSELINTLTNTNTKLFEMHEKREKMKVKEPDDISGKMVHNQQNNIFVGTTSDLAKMVQDLQNK